MSRLVVFLIAVAGCTSEYERTYGESRAAYDKRVSACDQTALAGHHVFTLVSTDRWRVGAAPFWSTSARVLETMGPPDSTFRALQIASGPAIEYLVYERPGQAPDGHVVVTVVNDSLAYLSSAGLRAGPLSTGQSRFELGAPLPEVREAFPESYECRDWNTAGFEYRDRFYPVLVVADSARGAYVSLLFKDEKLVGVGTDYYMHERRHGPMP